MIIRWHREVQQLFALKLLAHDNLAQQIEPNPCQEQCQSWVVPWDASSVRLLYPSCVNAAEHRISDPDGTERIGNDKVCFSRAMNGEC
jgi:hypothetical protein